MLNRTAPLVAAAVLAALSLGACSPAEQLPDSTPGVLQPLSLTVDSSLAQDKARAAVRAAQYFDTFWSTGRREWLDRSLAADFTDLTLPLGRPQGIPGPLAASEGFHTAIPDLSAELTQVLVVGDSVTARLRFRGHFTGTFGGRTGTGQAVDFIATDVYGIRDGRIATNAHIEDNLTFMKQIGAVS
ncbi:ester cyclase [Kutzneria viridogrisea]|uniref:Ester cyclase n=1 Tax=Kutzneria viridogrisea TaxID=47990 RepID=A0ABR6BM72_9PSEU|nr:putative ester cyclase [Kutzneria viridogrisea]